MVKICKDKGSVKITGLTLYDAYATNSRMASACAVQKMMTSVIFDRLKLSRVHVSRGTPSMGSRHCIPGQRLKLTAYTQGKSYTGLVNTEHIETPVERVCQNDGLQGVLFCAVQILVGRCCGFLVMLCSLFRRHDGVRWDETSRVESDGDVTAEAQLSGRSRTKT